VPAACRVVMYAFVPSLPYRVPGCFYGLLKYKGMFAKKTECFVVLSSSTQSESLKRSGR
jgi:hypothetical protein